jgi:hypothetical protein
LSVPTLQLLSLPQQPPLQVRPPAQLALHTPVVVLHAWFAGHWLESVQPQVPPARQTSVAPPAVQSVQAPLLPQALGAVPVWQSPPLQQPVAQGSVPLQEVVQRWLVASQLPLPAGQSAMALQPQNPPLPDGSCTQRLPVELPEQSEQAPPLRPQWALSCAAGARQVEPSQQPWLQVRLVPPLPVQLVVHWWLVGSQAIPSGQSCWL